MKNIITVDRMTGIFLLILVAGTLLVLPVSANARPETVPVEGVNYNANATLSNNLRQLRDKRINVTLDSGKTMAGRVKDVGDKLIHLEKIEGKEFYDALIRIDSINSIDTRFRTIKR